jgi:hypothetical protein
MIWFPEASRFIGGAGGALAKRIQLSQLVEGINVERDQLPHGKLAAGIDSQSRAAEIVPPA